MILKSIIAKRFRGIKSEDLITFLPGLNIVKGSDNEAGKSSLRMAITKALFQDPTSVSEDVRKLTSWGTDEPWEIELKFQTDSTSYDLNKNLSNGTCNLASIGSTERPIANKNAIANKITALTGCPSEVFFESTACIAQDEFIRIIPRGAAPAEKKTTFGTLTQRLEATLSGAQEADVSSILSKLYMKTHNKPAKGPYYHLSIVEEQIQKHTVEKAEQETKIKNLIEKRRELNSIKEQLEQICKDLPIKQDLLAKNNRILELQGSIDKDGDQYNNFERVRKFKEDLDTIDEQLKEFIYFSGKAEYIKQLNDSKYELQNLANQKKEMQDDLNILGNQKPALWKLILGVLGAGLFVGGLVAGSLISKYLFFGIGVAISGLIIFGYWLISQMTWNREKNSTSKKLDVLEEQIQNKIGTLKPILDSMGFKDYNEYQEEFAKYVEKLSKRNDPFTKLSGILGNKDWETFKTENSGLVIKMRANQEELNKLQSFKLDPLELQKLDTEINGEKGLLKRKADFEGQKTGLAYFFEHTDADPDQLASVEEELEWMKKEKAFWERKQKVFEITRQVLEEGHKQTLSRAADVLEKELCKHISTITDGRYNQVKIEQTKDLDLSIQTYSPEKQDWVNVSELSRATQDQFYICARFALVNIITEGKKPPLLLDDPFVNFHPKRLQRTIPLLQELAKVNQILIFTCSDAYDSYGNIILMK